jgi:hypothetical protein
MTLISGPSPAWLVELVGSVVASTVPLDGVAVKADETAVFAFPYAEVTAVPTLANCPLTPRAVLESFEVTPESTELAPPIEV